MAKRIYVPQINNYISFPDDMGNDEIASEIRKYLASRDGGDPKAEGQQKPTTDIIGALQHGVKSILPIAQRGFANQAAGAYNLLPFTDSEDEKPQFIRRWQESAEDKLRRLSEEFTPDTFAEKVASGIAGAPGTVATFAPYALGAGAAVAAAPVFAGSALVAGAAGLAAPSFLEGYGETGDVVEGLKRGAVGGIEGAAFGVAGKAAGALKGALPRKLAHGVGGAGVMAGSTAAQGGTPEDIAAAAATGFGLSAAMPGRPKKAPSSLQNAVQDAELIAARENIMTHAPSLFDKKIPGYSKLKEWAQEKFTNPAIIEENRVGSVLSETGRKLDPKDDPRFLGKAGPTTAASQAREGAMYGYTDTYQPNVTAPTISLTELIDIARPKNKFEQGLTVKGVPNWYVDMNVFLDTNRVKELRNRGIDFKGLTDDPDAVLASLKRNYSSETIKQWEQVQGHANDIGNFFVDMLQRSGRFSAEQAKKIKADKDYVSMQRYLDETDPRSKSTGGGKAIHQITGGSGQKIGDFLANTMALAERSYKEANQNYHHKALIDVLESSITPEQYVKPVKSISFTPVIGKKRGGSPTKKAVAPVPRPKFNDKDSILTIYRDGKAHSYELAPDIYHSLRIRGRPEIPDSLQVFFALPQKAKQMATLGYTGLNPGFSYITNPPRDMFSAMLQTGDPGKVGMGHLKRLWATTVGKKMERGVGPITDTEKNYLRSGAPIAGPVEADIKVGLSIRDKVINDSERFGFAKDLVKHPVDTFRDISAWSENINRLPEYLRAEQKYGAGTANANVAGRAWAKDVTLDFSRMGEYTRWANEFIPFFNAAIQGSSKFVRTMKERPVAATLQGIAQVTIPMMGLWAINKDEEWYQELPTWEKTLFAHFKVGDGPIIRVPLPFEWGILFGSMPVAMMDSYYSKDPKKLKASVDQAMKTLMPDFVPQIIKPAVEVFAGRDTFKDRNIESESMKRLLPEERYRASTPSIYKGVGSALGVSPLKVQHLAESYTGGLVKDPANFIDFLSGNDVKSTAPFVGRITSSQKRQGQSVDDFYTQKEEMTQAWTSAKRRHEAGDIIGARRILEDNADVLGLNPARIALLTRRRTWTIPERMKKFNKVADNMSSVRRGGGEDAEITALARLALGRN